MDGENRLVTQRAEAHVESGTVVEFNGRWRLFVAKDGAGKFTVFELLAPQGLKRGDAVQWARVGAETRMQVVNMRPGETFPANVLTSRVSRAYAAAFLKR
jgi:hypothetical protein